MKSPEHDLEAGGGGDVTKSRNHWRVNAFRFTNLVSAFVLQFTHAPHAAFFLLLLQGIVLAVDASLRFKSDMSFEKEIELGSHDQATATV